MDAVKSAEEIMIGSVALDRVVARCRASLSSCLSSHRRPVRPGHVRPAWPVEGGGRQAVWRPS